VREYRRVIDTEYLKNIYLKDGFSKEDVEDCFTNFLFGYEAWEDGEWLGTAYATFRNGEYTLDGYNRTNNIFGASALGREVLKELKEYTNIVHTWHDTVDKSVTALTKRLGFKVTQIVNEQTFLVLEI